MLRELRTKEFIVTAETIGTGAMDDIGRTKYTIWTPNGTRVVSVERDINKQAFEAIENYCQGLF